MFDLSISISLISFCLSSRRDNMVGFCFLVGEFSEIGFSVEPLMDGLRATNDLERFTLAAADFNSAISSFSSSFSSLKLLSRKYLFI